MSRPRAINRFVIHCSASPNGRRVTATDIDAWHKARGFRRAAPAFFQPQFRHLGYHWVIELDGTCVPGRSPMEIGAHVAGANADSLSVCLVGTSAFSPLQWQALAALTRELMALHPGISVVGHRDLSPDRNGDGEITRNEWLKTCPGFSVRDWLSKGLQPEPAHVLRITPPVAP